VPPVEGRLYALLIWVGDSPVGDVVAKGLKWMVVLADQSSSGLADTFGADTTHIVVKRSMARIVRTASFGENTLINVKASLKHCLKMLLSFSGVVAY